MPIYEYRCEKCGEFEHTQRITEPALQRCPTCKRKVQRLISNTSFQLKGSGWYVTDYARASSGKDQEKKDKKEKDAGGDAASAAGSAGSADGAAKSESSASESPKTESKKSAGNKKADKPARASA